MQGKAGIAMGIALTILALFIGLFGIAILIAAGEAANNATVAFAAVSLPLALLAGFLSWIVPRAQWAIAGALSAPGALVCIAGSWSSALMVPGAIWIVAVICAGAYLGGRLRRARLDKQHIPPS